MATQMRNEFEIVSFCAELPAKSTPATAVGEVVAAPPIRTAAPAPLLRTSFRKTVVSNEFEIQNKNLFCPGIFEKKMGPTVEKKSKERYYFFY